MQKIIVRKYEKDDRSYLRTIACDTAFMGEPAEVFFMGRGILADLLTMYFTDYEPESCFVAENDGKVVGYLLGTKNEKKLNVVFVSRILPKLFCKTLFSVVIFKKKNIIFLCNIFLSLLKGEFKVPRLIGKYPALLHINILRGFRKSGIGRRLIEIYINYLRQESIPAVHLGTKSENSTAFFEKQGFRLLYETKRSYFKYILGRDFKYCVYGMKL